MIGKTLGHYQITRQIGKGGRACTSTPRERLIASMWLDRIGIGLVVPLFLIVVSINIFATPGDPFWEKKDYRHWSEQECEKMLMDSPWAKGIYFQFSSSEYVVQLFSALPIRQAIVRKMEIADGYESLSPEKRREFDIRADKLLSEQFTSTIVVNVISGRRLRRDIFQSDKPEIYPCPYWEGPKEMVQNTTFLIPSKGDKVPLQQHQYVSPHGDGCELRFIFPRQYKGHPVLGTKDKYLALEFMGTNRTADGKQEEFVKILAEFNVKKMIIDGAIAY